MRDIPGAQPNWVNTGVLQQKKIGVAISQTCFHGKWNENLQWKISEKNLFPRFSRQIIVFNYSSFTLKICKCLAYVVLFVLRKFRFYQIDINEEIERIIRKSSTKIQ